jgi:hypothetical protein
MSTCLTTEKSLLDTLEVVSSYLDKKLVSSDGLQGIHHVASLLPNLPSLAAAGFECHLAKMQTDILVAFESKNSGEMVLNATSSQLTENPIWRKVNDFSSIWSDLNCHSKNCVDNVWLEFDVDQHSEQAMPEPSLFFAPFGLFADKQKVYTESWNIDRILQSLSSHSLNKETLNFLTLCTQKLPDSAVFFQVGIMLPRAAESNIIRLCVDNLNSEQLLQYLNSIGWQDRDGELSNLLSTLSGCTHVFRLNFAIQESVLPRIGLECYLDRQPVGSSQWQLMKNFLIDHHLSGLEKIQAIERWPGYSLSEDHQELWPEQYANSSAFLGNNIRSAIVRLLHHIKIVYQPGRQLEAKAYLWFGHRWLTSQGTFVQ